MTRGTLLRWLIGLVISAVFVWLAFRSINLGDMWSSILHADQRYLIPTTLCTLLAYLLRALRWKLCFVDEDEVTFGQSSWAYAVGVFISQFIPARLGDLVRVYVIGQFSGVSKSKALGTLVVERLSDMFAVVILLTVLLPRFSLPSWIKVADGFAAAVAVVALVVVYLLAQRGEDMAPPAWVARRRLLRAAFGLLMLVLAGFSAVRDWRRGLSILAVSFAVWIAQTGTYALLFGALNIPLGWKEGALATMVLALTAIVPAGPGFAGTFEIASQNLLGLFGVPAQLATNWLEYSRIPTFIACALFLVVGFALVRLARSSSKAAAEVRLAAEPAELRSTA